MRVGEGGIQAAAGTSATTGEHGPETVMSVKVVVVAAVARQATTRRPQTWCAGLSSGDRERLRKAHMEAADLVLGEQGPAG
ncbi:MAG TPA: hypothetical protein VGN19_13055 [Pedococcus sp.]|nr:hypothetical protein [Pedococcus sp.]